MGRFAEEGGRDYHAGMKLLLAGLLVVAIGACGGGGGDDDGTMPDAANDPFQAMPCASDWGSAGSDLLACDTACVHSPTYTGDGCGLATNPGDMLMDRCTATFTWGSNSGCCERVDDLSGHGAYERYLECR